MATSKKERVHRFKATKVDYKIRMPGNMAVPNQSMKVKDIVERFTRGLPVDVKQQDGVYLEQVEHDFEQLQRMGFADKFEFSQQLREKAARVEAALKAKQKKEEEKLAADRRSREEEREGDDENAQRSEGRRGPAIDSLDDTMADDTRQSSKQLRKGKQRDAREERD